MSSITISHGSEGSHNDPYGYEEIAVQRKGTTVMLHDGLVRFLEVHREGGHDTIRYREPDDNLEELFEQIAGISVKTARRSWERLVSRCSECGSRDFKYVMGFPGETIQVCAKCDHVQHCYLDLGAIQ